MSNGGAQHWSHQFIDSSGNPYSGVKVYHTAAGTDTLKNVWTDEGKVTPAANPVVGDSSGTVSFYADGDYKFVIKDTADVTLYTWDNIKITSDTATLWEGNVGTAYPSVTANNLWQQFLLKDASNNLLGLGINTGTEFVPFTPGVWSNDSDASAVANKTMILSSTVTLTANTIIPASVSIMPINPGVIVSNGFTLTINGPVVGNPMHQWLSGFTYGWNTPNEVIFGPNSVEIINVNWYGAKGDGVTDDTTAIRLAFASVGDMNTTYPKKLLFPSGRYRITKPIYIGKWIGGTSFTWAGESVTWNGGLGWTKSGLTVIGSQDPLYNATEIFADYSTSYPMFVLLGSRNVTFTDMRIRGNGGSAKASEGIFLAGHGQGFTLRNSRVSGCMRALRLGNNYNWPEDPIAFTGIDWMVEFPILEHAELEGETASLSVETAQTIHFTCYTSQFEATSALGYGIFLNAGRITLIEPLFIGSQNIDIYADGNHGTIWTKVYGGHTESTGTGIRYQDDRAAGAGNTRWEASFINFNGGSIILKACYNLILYGGDVVNVDLYSYEDTVKRHTSIKSLTIGGKIGNVSSTASAVKDIVEVEACKFDGGGSITSPFNTYFGSHCLNILNYNTYVGPSFTADILAINSYGLSLSSKEATGGSHVTMGAYTDRPNSLYGIQGGLACMVDAYRENGVEKAATTTVSKLTLDPSNLIFYKATGQTINQAISPWVMTFNTEIRSGSSSPAGVVTPNFIGEEYLHTTGNHWYKAHGLTDNDWTALN